MSNELQAHVEADLPFDFYKSSKLAEYVGIINAPTIGFWLEWRGEDSYYIPNQDGSAGKTLMVPCELGGSEAVRLMFLVEFVSLIHEVRGKVKVAKYRDVTNSTGWERIPELKCKGMFQTRYDKETICPCGARASKMSSGPVDETEVIWCTKGHVSVRINEEEHEGCHHLARVFDFVEFFKDWNEKFEEEEGRCK